MPTQEEITNCPQQFLDGRSFREAILELMTGSGTLGLTTDNATGDAFGRLRASFPYTLFESKQSLDNQPLFWDEELESGGGISSAHSTDTASTVITSTLNTAGLFTRQTFMRFNYQPGKSQLVLMTGVLQRSGGGTGVKRRIGLFDDENGLFFEDDDNTVGVVVRSFVTGSTVDTRVEQSSWNLDKMDGTGISGITVDWSKAQIFVIDFEWLGVGRVRFGLNIDGVTHYVHEVLNANVITTVYMSSPNLPLRYQLETTASSPASTLEAICSSVLSEGGLEDIGVLRHLSTDGTHVDADVANTVYAVLGIRLKTDYLGAVIKLVATTMLAETNDDFEWILLLNPDVAGTFTYAPFAADSAVEVARGATANTVTNGTAVAGGFASTAQKSISSDLENSLYLGAAIDGTRDEFVLCVRPLANTADIQGTLTWREIF